jgi:hypothetical protein
MRAISAPTARSFSTMPSYPINVIHAVNERFPASELVHDIRANTPEIMGVRCRRYN